MKWLYCNKSLVCLGDIISLYDKYNNYIGDYILYDYDINKGLKVKKLKNKNCEIGYFGFDWLNSKKPIDNLE